MRRVECWSGKKPPNAIIAALIHPLKWTGITIKLWWDCRFPRLLAYTLLMMAIGLSSHICLRRWGNSSKSSAFLHILTLHDSIIHMKLAWRFLSKWMEIFHRRFVQTGYLSLCKLRRVSLDPNLENAWCNASRPCVEDPLPRSQSIALNYLRVQW